ncbi:hypothetical protein E2562_000627 [Oryza meyeriana var. granulata]|uniref:Uncharacterized protein n=1 Tax=Oryza meyeriana var. granulata TaxID=110450 RepID=A0A6G1DU54_9ORYZ|nr:hypothetical protein E2562_000627 [Oryza meyeriana var. granulata]
MVQMLSGTACDAGGCGCGCDGCAGCAGGVEGEGAGAAAAMLPSRKLVVKCPLGSGAGASSEVKLPPRSSSRRSGSMAVRGSGGGRNGSSYGPGRSGSGADTGGGACTVGACEGAGAAAACVAGPERLRRPVQAGVALRVPPPTGTLRSAPPRVQEAKLGSER